jgi:hypothetical protein
MKRKHKLAGATLVAVLSFAGGVTATQVGGSVVIYIANFDWRTSSGAEAYPKFVNVWGQLTHYEPVSMNSGSPSCTEIGSVTLNSTDQTIWYQESSGGWAFLADNVSNGTDPHAVVYTDGSADVELRIADIWATPVGYLQVRSRYYAQPPDWGYEEWCDVVAYFGNRPYLKMKNGTISVWNQH